MANSFITDIEGCETDDRCGMKYWLMRLESGRGIVPKVDIIPDAILEATHADLRTLAEMEDITPVAIQGMIDDALERLTSKDKDDKHLMELLYRRLGWLASFALYVEPVIRAEYETIKMDSEILLDNRLWVIVKPDRVIRGREHKEILYREYVPMPTGYETQKWLQGWFYNIRLHAGMAAVNEILDSGKVTYGQVMGLNLGYKSLVDGRLQHPYTYGYFNADTRSWSPMSKPNKGEVTPVWKYPGGIMAWVELCGKEIADYQFPISPRVSLNERILDGWLARRLNRERAMASNKGACVDNLYLRGVYFPKVTSQCRPPSGEPCPYLQACWNPQVEPTPMKYGGFVPNPNNL